MKKETRVNHQPGVELPVGNRSVVNPLYRSVKFTYPTIADSLTAEAREHGFDYTRGSNPTTRELELLCARLQDRDDAIAVATGMAAIWLSLLSNLEAGDRVVIFLESYRPTRIAVRKLLPRFDIQFSLLSIHDEAGIARVFAETETKLVVFEAPTNPMLEIPNIARLVELAKQHDVVTVLDNTFAGLHNHGQFEIDYYAHSMTKYGNGHGDVMGGIVIGSKQRIKAMRLMATNMGSTMDPGAAFLILRGMKTYYVRFQRQSETALALAEFLSARSEVERVFYPGLASHPGHELAKRQMEDFGGVLSFDLKADEEQTWAFIDALELFATAASLGSTESLVSPVLLYLGGDLTAEQQAEASIKDSTVRFAVGLEHVDDLIADVSQALVRVFG